MWFYMNFKGLVGHCITTEQKLNFFNAIKLENNTQVQDDVHTLIIILEHFTRGVIDHREKNKILL